MGSKRYVKHHYPMKSFTLRSENIVVFQKVFVETAQGLKSS